MSAPRRRTKRIAIVGHTRRNAVRLAATKLVSRLGRRGCEVRLDRDLAATMNRAGEPFAKLGAWCDLMISLGGDGTVLTAGRAIAGRRGVLLPINLGGLGFLAAAEESELDRAVDAALAGR